MDRRKRGKVAVSLQASDRHSEQAKRCARFDLRSRRDARTDPRLRARRRTSAIGIVRYNRLIDTFLGLTTYSLQNHLRTTVKGIGQIEIDELYIGLDKHGCHYVVPVQAKGGKDRIGVVQTTQDIRYVAQKFPGVRCRSIAAQFMDDAIIAMCELALQSDEVKVVEERHYKLVPATELDSTAIRSYR